MRRIRIFNRQRALVLERVLLRCLTRTLLEECLDRHDYELGVHFIAADEMAGLNETFLGHHGSTDVITFNHQEDAGKFHLAPSPPRQSKSGAGETRLPGKKSLPKALSKESNQQDVVCARICGEIFICVDDALIYARRFHVRWPVEITRYLVHGVLHLEGFNDTDPVSRRAMKRQENKLLKELSHRFNLGKLGKSCP